MQERSREGQPLAVAQGEHADPPIRALTQAQQLHGLGDGGARRTCEPALDVEVLAHGQIGVGGRGLDEVADAREHIARAGPHPPAEDDDLAAVGTDEAQQHADGGRLAGAVPAEEGVDLAGAHIQIEPVDGAHLAVPFAQSASGDGGWAAHVGRPS
jgi:hypothetical protein